MLYCKISKQNSPFIPKICFFITLWFALCTGSIDAKGRTDSELAKAYFEIAQAYTEVAKYDKAAVFYLKAAADPAHKNAAEYNLARVYGLQGNWQQARIILERQHKEAVGNLLILKAFAYSLAATGDEERACEIYKTLYETDTEDPEAGLNYARILTLAKHYDKALSLLEELKKRFTETAEKKLLDELEQKIKKAQAPADETETENIKETQNDTVPADQKTDTSTPDNAQSDPRKNSPPAKTEKLSDRPSEDTKQAPAKTAEAPAKIHLPTGTD